MDGHRGPGVPTVTWVTLGLLAFSWLIISGVVGWVISDVPWEPTAFMLIGVVWLFFSGPLWLFAIAAWRAEHWPEMFNVCLFFAVIYAGSIVALGLSVAADARLYGIPLIVGLGWIIGWLTSPFAVFYTFIPNKPDNDH